MKSFAIIFSIIVTLVSCSQYSYKKTGLEGQPLPNVKLRLVDSSHYFNTANIPNGQWSILFYFSTQCPHCRAQMHEMINNINELNDIKIYAATFSSYQSLQKFTAEFKLNRCENVVACSDYTDTLLRYFKIKSVPFTAIYNPKKKLSCAFSGKMTVNQIKNAISLYK